LSAGREPDSTFSSKPSTSARKHPKRSLSATLDDPSRLGSAPVSDPRVDVAHRIVHGVVVVPYPAQAIRWRSIASARLIRACDSKRRLSPGVR
jgi:hypothetical protein